MSNIDQESMKRRFTTMVDEALEHEARHSLYVAGRTVLPAMFRSALQETFRGPGESDEFDEELWVSYAGAIGRAGRSQGCLPTSAPWPGIVAERGWRLLVSLANGELDKEEGVQALHALLESSRDAGCTEYPPLDSGDRVDYLNGPSGFRVDCLMSRRR